MKKSDLREHDILLLRDGTMEMVINSCDGMVIHIGDLFWGTFGDYNEDLTSKTISDWDVIEVKRHVVCYTYIRKFWDHAPTIWRRKEPKKMTISEICDAIGYEVEIIQEG